MSGAPRPDCARRPGPRRRDRTPAGPSLKAGAFASHDIKRPLPAILRSRRPQRPWISCSPSFALRPRPRGEWSADRRTRLLRRACEARQPRERNADRPVATGTTSRRSTVAIFGRRPAPASPAVAPDARSGLSAPGQKSRRTVSRTSHDAVTRRNRRTPLPAPPSGSSPETPLDERGCKPYTPNSLRSQV